MLVAQSCPTLCDPMDSSPQESSVHGIFQARILEWVAISSFGGFSQLKDPTQVSCIAGRFFTTEPPEKPSFLLNKQAKPLSPTIPGHKVLNGEDLLEKEMATHYSILAWRIPWTEEPGGLQSMGSQRVRRD